MGNREVVYLDTHAVIWLLSGDLDWMSRRTRKLLESAEVLISPMVMLELDMLREIRRVRLDANGILRDLQYALDLRICDMPFERVIRAGLGESWTRDPFDRLIVAQAREARSKLLTIDKNMSRHYDRAIH